MWEEVDADDSLKRWRFDDGTALMLHRYVSTPMRWSKRYHLELLRGDITNDICQTDDEDVALAAADTFMDIYDDGSMIRQVDPVPNWLPHPHPRSIAEWLFLPIDEVVLAILDANITEDVGLSVNTQEPYVLALLWSDGEQGQVLDQDDDLGTLYDRAHGFMVQRQYLDDEKMQDI